jgi:prepilin peptidase CpaA
MMVMTLEHIRVGAVLVVAIVAVAFDLRTRRIPNVLTFGAAILAMLFAILSGGLPATLTAAFAWMLGVALFLPFFALGGMGAGDVKLLAALAAWLGPVDAVYMAIFTAMAGGVIGLAVTLARGYTRRALSNIWLMLMHWRVVGPKPVPGLTLSDGHAPRLAYAIPIAVGALCTLWRH